MHDLSAEEKQQIDGEMFDIIQRAIDLVVGLFLPLLANEYMVVEEVFDEENAISLESLERQMMGVAMDKIELECSVADNRHARPLSLSEFLAFRASAPKNRYRVVMHLIKDRIMLNKGLGLTNYDVLHLHYPAQPERIESPKDLVDVPDGPAIEIVILKGKKIVAGRLKMPEKDYGQEAEKLIKNLYEQFGLHAEMKTLKSQVQALQ